MPSNIMSLVSSLMTYKIELKHGLKYLVKQNHSVSFTCCISSPAKAAATNPKVSLYERGDAIRLCSAILILSPGKGAANR